MSNQKTSADCGARPPPFGPQRRTTTGVVDLHRQLLDIAFDLSVEFDTLPGRVGAAVLRARRPAGPDEGRRGCPRSRRRPAGSPSRACAAGRPEQHPPGPLGPLRATA